MRLKPVMWLIISVLCFIGAFYFWHLGERWAAQKKKGEGRGAKVEGTAGRAAGNRHVEPASHKPEAGALNSAAAAAVRASQVLKLTNRFALRLTNTKATISQLQRSDSAILLQNALLDTTQGAPAIPAQLQAKGDPGAWIVQARGPIGNGFRSVLADAGATIVSYIPNNAYLVRASEAVAQQLQGGPLVQAVLPYEPYYKLNASLLKYAVAQEPLPANRALNVLLFADAADQTRGALEGMGAQVLAGPDRTPFGPVYTFGATAPDIAQPGALLSAIAGLPGVQEVEWALARVPANDLSRVRVGVATDPVVTSNYFGLTGTNVLVNVNDTGIDATHPDLAPRVFGLTTNALVDANGHGTHVAGIIASSGGKSSTVTNASGPLGPYYGTNNQFRGMAPDATLFSVPFGLSTTPFSVGQTLGWPSDGYLQQTPAQTNCFISNNSWNYTGPDDYPSYDLHAASYDAAVRDALPFQSNSQPLLIVFSAGDAGGGDTAGQEGNADSILSPATAKNVITVGAIEQDRNITNMVHKVSNGITNISQPWLAGTDSSNQVASFSSRGNVGVGIEGQYGRFKPDVVAPGVFVVSTKSQQWDTNAYYNPTSHLYYFYPDLVVPTNEIYRQRIFVPDNAVRMQLYVESNTNSPVPFPDMPLYVKQSGPPTNPPPDYDVAGTNYLSLPPDHALDPVDAYWYYGIGNITTQNVAFDFVIDLTVTNELGDYLDVLAGMNNGLGPYYRYESGTSMAAADTSGVLALMQEFFWVRQSRTNSPALMKALLINGARTLGSPYDFATQPNLNYQGWGLINLPTTLQPGLTNTSATSSNSIIYFDQNPATALATGQSQTYHVSLSPTAQMLPLRITLVWTDPPGNPAAAIKLVNDLDLVVTNLDTTNLVYFGNDIPAGNTFNENWQSNTVPNVDNINNVENVYLDPSAGINGRLGTNYSITVYGHHVNVNAVDAQTNNVSQDYALVVSTGDGLTTNATITLVTNGPMVSLTQPVVTIMTNSFGQTTPDYEGGLLLNQRAGANTQLQGTNLLALTNDANAVLTVGMTNQWHFYMISNTTGFTNAAFLTFAPVTLSIPRMGVFSPSLDNATRGEADIDLYVAPPTIPNNFALTNLDTNVLAAASKGLGRGGTEMVIYSNAVNGVYYFGVKSEDQMAAQYTIMGVFSRLPFGTTDANGDQLLVGIPTYAAIPDGSPQTPGFTEVIAICAEPIMVRRVIVTNTIAHQQMTDLLGNLAHSGQFDVLNNHTCASDPASGQCYTYYTYIYDDSDEKNVPGAQPTDGPGSLHNFAAQDGVGPWVLTMTDNQINHVGTNIELQLFLEKQPDLSAPGGIIATIQPGACREDYLTLPSDAVGLTIDAGIVTATPPILFTMEVCPFNTSACKSTTVTNAAGGEVTIDLTDSPPLQPGGTYTVRICNLGVTPITLNIHATIAISLATLYPTVTLHSAGPQPIADDAVTDYYITNTTHGVISSVDLGLLVNDLRSSDLAVTLMSPNGTRVLVFENRGAAQTAGIGTFSLTTNFAMQACYTNNFDAAAVGLYSTGAVFQGWSVVSNQVQVLDDFDYFFASNHVVGLLDGVISNTLPTTNALAATNNYPYTLSYTVNHLPWLEGMVTWWPLDVDGSDIFGGMDGLLFGDVKFSAGMSTPLFDDFAGPLNPNWQPYLPDVPSGANPALVETYTGASGYYFTNIGPSTVILLTNKLSAQQRVGWRSALSYVGQSFRYDVRFNTLTQNRQATTGRGLLELWVMDALYPARYDAVSLFIETNGAVELLPTSSIDPTNATLSAAFANNAWYHLVVAGTPGRPIRASLFDDSRNELNGMNFAHGPSAFSSGFRVGLSEYMVTAAASSPVSVAVDSATLNTTMMGEVNQAYLGDGDATRMIVPGCAELNLGLGRGFSIEGWVWPGYVGAGSNAGSNSGPKTVSVPAYYNYQGWPYNGANLWVDTGINVAAGQVLSITASGTASCGAYSSGPDGGPWVTPLGSTDFSGDAIDPVAELVSLIGKVGGTTAVGTGTFVPSGKAGQGDGFVGSRYSQIMQQSGRLFLGYNDQVWFQDNSGSYSATITVSNPPAAAPLVEWYNANTNTDGMPFGTGVQFWLGGLPGITNSPGSLWANILDTNLQSHIFCTTTNVLTNGGWQHVALTYDTNSGVASLYVNGPLTNGLPLARTNLGRFVPRTSGDVYLGYDPPTVPTPPNYPSFASVAGLGMVGTAAQSGNVLRLTPASESQMGMAYAKNKQPCAKGFDTTFQFRMSNLGSYGGATPGADGIAFTIQKACPNMNSGFPNDPSGGAPSCNFVSVWLNTGYNWPGCTDYVHCDMSDNCMGVVTNALYAAQMDLVPLGLSLKDGNAHTVRVTYDGLAMNVWLDGTQRLANVAVPALAGATDTNGYAYVGFGAFTGWGWADQDILSWTYSGSQTASDFGGGLDEFSLYNRALTPCEVGAIHNAGSGGKYGNNVLVCPVVTSVTLSNTPLGVQTFIFTNGVSWVTNGPHWETNTILFSTTGTNPTPIVVAGYKPYDTNSVLSEDNLNADVDNFVLSQWVQETTDGLLYFTDNTNLAVVPIKFGPTPYTESNFPPVLVFSNDFSDATAGVFQAGATLWGEDNGPGIGRRNWTVSAGQVTVISNSFLDPWKTNCLAMATGAVQCLLPTIPGHRYQLTYTLRGPSAVGWWNGAVNPLDQRAWDLISGNDGAFYAGATNVSPGFVGRQCFFFNGQTEPPPPLDPDLWPEDIDDPSGQIELGDPPQLQLTNAFTIEAWIMPAVPTNADYCGTEQIFFRGYPEPFNCLGLGDPYWLALEPTADPFRYDIHFHIANAHYGTIGADVLTTNAPILIFNGTNSASTNGGWYHLAAVFDKPFTNSTIITNGTNTITFWTNQMRLYLDGTLIASNYTTMSPYGPLDPALNPGADIGERCRFDWTEPFAGLMDEVTVYARALTPPEIAAIASAGTSGKADLASEPPPLSLAKMSVTVDGVPLGIGFGYNAQWTTQSVAFTALDTNAVVTLQSLLPGTLLEGIALTEQPSDLYYLPEEPLSTLAGEDAYGVWTLEVWDSRVGPANTAPVLDQWQLGLHLAPSNPPPVITLQHGVTYSNSLPAHQSQDFIVPVPQWARRATNVLEFAHQVHTTNDLSALVYINTTNFPVLTNLVLLNGPPYPTAPQVLGTNTIPAITNGQTYYLLLTNPNPVGMTFNLQVAFDITTLTNCELTPSNQVAQAGIPRYFQFDVPTNFPLTSLPPQAVSFWVSNTSCNLKVVLSEHLPLPDLDHYDYISEGGCTNSQVVMVMSNSTPFPIQTNRWYVGVFNTSTTNVSFSAQACLSAPYPVVIELTNALPFVVASPNSPYAAPPGPPQWLFFEFTVTNNEPGLLFELYNLPGNADLVLEQAFPPTMAPYFYTSFFEGNSAEQIVLRSDATRPADVYLPDLRGEWYLGVYNHQTNNLTYTIRAILPDNNLLLDSALPLKLFPTPLSPPHGLLLSWNSVVGERYFVQYTTNLATPILWANLGMVAATTTLTTFEVVPTPPPGATNGAFFRVVQVYSDQPILHIMNVTNRCVRLYWDEVYSGYTLQYKDGILGPWLSLVTKPPAPYPPYPPAAVETPNYAAYDTATNLVPRFYRLHQ